MVRRIVEGKHFKKSDPNKKLMLIVEYRKPHWNMIGDTIEREHHQITSKNDFGLDEKGFVVWPNGDSSKEIGYAPGVIIKYSLEEWDIKTTGYEDTEGT